MHPSEYTSFSAAVASIAEIVVSRRMKILADNDNKLSCNYDPKRGNSLNLRAIKNSATLSSKISDSERPVGRSLTRYKPAENHIVTVQD